MSRRRPSAGIRGWFHGANPGWTRLSLALALGGGASSLAATNLISADDIPPLRPARPELPPGFWEQYGGWVIAGCVVLVVLATAAIVWLSRPKPAPPLCPAAEAREALDRLRGQPEDGALLSRVSQVLRHYVMAVFGLPPGELTTTEFCRALIPLDRIGPPLSVPLTDFLRECDRRKFAPGAPVTESIAAVNRALDFIKDCEARLEQSRRATSTRAG